MHVTNRGPNTWQLTWEMGRDPATGERSRKRQTFHGTEKEAQKAWFAEQARIERGTAVQGDTATLQAWAAEWLENRRPPTLRPGTWQNYADVLHGLILPQLGLVRLRDLRAPHVQRAILAWRQQPRKRPPKEDPTAQLSPRSVQLAYDLLAQILDQAVKWQLIDRNVARLVDRPAVEKRQRPWWDAPTMERFLRQVADHRDGIGFALALMAGLRRGEICGLRWEAVDWDARQVIVRETRVLVHGQATISRPKTAASERTVPLSDGLCQWLRLHHARQARWKLQHPEWVQDSGYVLQTRRGTPLNPRNLLRTFRGLCARADAPPIAFHDLRHTFASHLVDAGVNVRVVADLLGHTNVAFTLQTYVHADISAHRAGVEQVSARARPQMGHMEGNGPQPNTGNR